MTDSFITALLCFVVLLLTSTLTEGHGRLREPPSRGSMWRDGFNTPRNYNDNELNCGGRGHQWESQQGRCGICGDPFDRKREHEAGGKYAKEIIGRAYKEGATIEVKVQVTAQHKGWFEFRLCPNNNVKKAASKECLDRYLLEVVGSRSGSRFNIPKGDQAKTYQLRVRLPQGVTCSQCVFQWKWNTGNSWGTDPDGTGCVGCGAQEQFYGCSDVAINADNNSPTDKVTTMSRTERNVNQKTTQGATSTEKMEHYSTTSSSPSMHTKTTLISESPATASTTEVPTTKRRDPQTAPSNCRATNWFKPLGGDAFCQKSCPRFCPRSHCICEQTSVVKGLKCRPTHKYRGIAAMKDWCDDNCPEFCPQSHCLCRAVSKLKKPRCKPTVTYTAVTGMQGWCNNNCAAGYCPRTHCICQ